MPKAHYYRIVRSRYHFGFMMLRIHIMRRISKLLPACLKCSPWTSTDPSGQSSIGAIQEVVQALLRYVFRFLNIFFVKMEQACEDFRRGGEGTIFLQKFKELSCLMEFNRSYARMMEVALGLFKGDDSMMFLVSQCELSDWSLY